MVGKTTGSFEFLHRLPAGHLGDLDRDVRHARVRGNRVDRGDGRFELQPRDASNVHLEIRQIRHDVWSRSGLEHADVGGHAGPATVQALDPLDHPGAGEDRVPAHLGLDTRVGSAAVHAQAQVRDALARRDEVAVGAGAFQDEAKVRFGRDLTDVRGGARRSDLLVRVRHIGDSFERQMVPVVAPEPTEGPERVHSGDEPTLHVGDPCTPGDLSVDCERPLRHRAVREDRVHMSNQQDPGSGAGTAPDRADDGVAVAS